MLSAREGAKLIIADMNVDGGQQTVHMITENGGDATFVQVDVTQATEVEEMISKTVETYGRLDCAHNNAGPKYRSLPSSLRLPNSLIPPFRGVGKNTHYPSLCQRPAWRPPSELFF